MKISVNGQNVTYTTQLKDFTFNKVKNGYNCIELNFDWTQLDFSKNNYIKINMPGIYKKKKVTTIGKDCFKTLDLYSFCIKNITYSFHPNNTICLSTHLFTCNQDIIKDETLKTFLKIDPKTLFHYTKNTNIHTLVLNKKFNRNTFINCSFYLQKITYFQQNNNLYTVNKFGTLSLISIKINHLKNYYQQKTKNYLFNPEDELNYQVNLMSDQITQNPNYYHIEQNLFNNHFMITDYNCDYFDLNIDDIGKQVHILRNGYTYNNIVTHIADPYYWNLSKEQLIALKEAVKNCTNEYQTLLTCVKFCLGTYKEDNTICSINNQGIKYYLQNKTGVCRHVTNTFARVLQLCGVVNKTVECTVEIDSKQELNDRIIDVEGHLFNAIYLKSKHIWVYLDLTLIKMSDVAKQDFNLAFYFNTTSNYFFINHYANFNIASILYPANTTYWEHFLNINDALAYLGCGLFSNTLRNQNQASIFVKSILGKHHPKEFSDDDLFSIKKLKKTISLLNCAPKKQEIITCIKFQQTKNKQWTSFKNDYVFWLY